MKIKKFIEQNSDANYGTSSNEIFFEYMSIDKVNELVEIVKKETIKDVFEYFNLNKENIDNVNVSNYIDYKSNNYNEDF